MNPLKIYIARVGSRENPSFQKNKSKLHYQFYQDRGRSICLTINTLGYPEKSTFKHWLNEAFQNRTKHCISGGVMVEYSKKYIDLLARNEPAAEVAQRHGVSRVTLYQWKKQLLCKELCAAVPKKSTTRTSIKAERTDLTVEELQSEKLMLEKQIAILKKAVYQLQLERDVFEKAAGILKKIGASI